MRQQFCKRDHDTYVTGRYKNGNCKECHKILQRTPEARNKKREINRRRQPTRRHVPGLRRWRLQVGLSQRELAERCGVAKITILKAERGEKVNMETYRKISSQFYGNTMPDLDECIDIHMLYHKWKFSIGFLSEVKRLDPEVIGKIVTTEFPDMGDDGFIL